MKDGTEMMSWRFCQSFTNMAKTPTIASPRGKKKWMIMPHKVLTSLETVSTPGTNKMSHGEIRQQIWMKIKDMVPEKFLTAPAPAPVLDEDKISRRLRPQPRLPAKCQGSSDSDSGHAKRDRSNENQPFFWNINAFKTSQHFHCVKNEIKCVQLAYANC